MIDQEIEKISGGNKEAEELLKKLVDDIFNNMSNPKTMMNDIESTIQNQFMTLLKVVCKK